MIYSNTASTTIVNAAAPLSFTTDTVKTCNIRHSEGGTSFTLSRRGQYLVQFNASVSIPSGGSASLLSVKLQRNGVDVPGAISSFYSAADTDVGSLSFSAIVPVGCSCPVVNNSTALTFVNGAAQAEFSNFAVTITKLP